MSDNDNHQPISGKLYRVANLPGNLSQLTRDQDGYLEDTLILIPQHNFFYAFPEEKTCQGMTFFW